MNQVFNTYRPEGFETLNSYLFADEPELLITFLSQAFFAIEEHRTLNKNDGSITNCILRIGTSCLMVAQSTGVFKGMRSAIYIFVDDVDQIHRRALEHGATSVFEPEDMDYGDRQSGVMDTQGNYWWISKRLNSVAYHENEVKDN